jgi:hypothetical protein
MNKLKREEPSELYSLFTTSESLLIGYISDNKRACGSGYDVVRRLRACLVLIVRKHDREHNLPAAKWAGFLLLAVEQLVNMGKKNSTLGRLGPWPATTTTAGIPSAAQSYSRTKRGLWHRTSCRRDKENREAIFIVLLCTASVCSR